MPVGRTVLVGRHELFVREAGPADGPPLVLIHGWVYDSVATWHRILPALAERRRVIAVDLRNHGRSERIRGAFTIEDLADQVAGVLLPLQEKDGSWWDYPFYDYHQQYGTAFALLTLVRCRH